jgi:hypothetical protein
MTVAPSAPDHAITVGRGVSVGAYRPSSPALAPNRGAGGQHDGMAVGPDSFPSFFLFIFIFEKLARTLSGQSRCYYVEREPMWYGDKRKKCLQLRFKFMSL